MMARGVPVAHAARVRGVVEGEAVDLSQLQVIRVGHDVATSVRKDIAMRFARTDQRRWRTRRVRLTVAPFVSALLVVALVAGCENPKEPARVASEPQVLSQPAGEQTQASKNVGKTTADAGFAEEQRKRAGNLYGLHCAGCHGENGNGVSVAGRFLFPKPRDFRAGRFRLISTANGIPTLRDLENVLVRGMPGSSMPPWPQLSESDRRLLSEQVLEFRREGIRDKERATAKEDGDEVDVEEMEKLVVSLTTPGDPIEVPDLGQPSTEVIARGRHLFLTVGCAACHGKEGRGDGQQKMIDEEGLPTRPRDLTKGLFKGSSQPQSIYRLYLAGMPGTPMPALRKNTPQELSDLTHFVLSLSDEKTRATTVLNRERIVVRRVPTAPDAPDAVAWQDIAPVPLRTVPLWWRDEFPSAVEVRAVHDGKSIAFQLSWSDASADEHTGKTESFRDAVAVELFRGAAEPFLGMGSVAAPIDVWLWSAGRNVPQDLEDVNPNVVVDQYPFAELLVDTAEYRRAGTQTEKQPPLSLPALASGNQNVPGNAARFGGALEAAGPGTVTFRPAVNQSVETQGVWKKGRWCVVLKRPLAASEPQQGLSLKTGQRGEPARQLSRSRVGEGLSRPIQVRLHLHLGLCSERHAHVPAAGVRPQRCDAPQRAELRPRPHRRSVRQQGDESLEPARLSEGIHDAAPHLRAVSAQGTGASQRLEGLGGRRLSVAVGQTGAADEVQVR